LQLEVEHADQHGRHAPEVAETATTWSPLKKHSPHGCTIDMPSSNCRIVSPRAIPCYRLCRILPPSPAKENRWRITTCQNECEQFGCFIDCRKAQTSASKITTVGRRCTTLVLAAILDVYSFCLTAGNQSTSKTRSFLDLCYTISFSSLLHVSYCSGACWVC